MGPVSFCAGWSWPLPPRLAAALWALAATLTFSLVYSSGKLIGGIVPAFQIVLIRFASGFIVALIAARATGHGWRQMFTTERRSLHFLRALCGAGAGVATIYATFPTCRSPTQRPSA